MEKSYKQVMNDINAFVFDVDGVLTDGSLHISESGELLRTMNVKDGFAIKVALTKGYEVAIISGGKNEAVKTRLQALGINDVYLGVSDKTEVLKEFKQKYKITNNEILYMGDDIPDICVMNQVVLPCCPQDAVQEVKAASKYISHKSGGKGAVRDVIEQVLKVHQKWKFDSNKF